MKENIEYKIGQIETKVDNLISMQERQTNILDELTKEWSKFGGFIQSQADLQRQINEARKWIDDNRYDIKDLLDSKKDTKRRIKDILFQYGSTFIMGLLAIYFALIGKNK